MSVTGDLRAVQLRVEAIAGDGVVPGRAPDGASRSERSVLGSGEFARLVRRASAVAHVSSSLIAAVARAESGMDPFATSSTGAAGIMQLMPATAAALGVTDPYDPAANIRGGAIYLRELLDRFNGNVRLAVAAYNAGPGAVERYGGVPPFAETQGYVSRVLDAYRTQTAR